MNSLVIAAVILVLMGLAYQQGFSKSTALANGKGVKLHSRPYYHGAYVALWVLVPALLIVALWAVFGPGVTNAFILSSLPADVVNSASTDLPATVKRIESIASGYGIVGEVLPYEAATGEALSTFQNLAQLLIAAAAAGVGILTLLLVRKRITPQLRARNAVEKVIGFGLISCSAVAILTTLGIVLSLFTEAMRFFTFIHPADFFFGTVWNPRFSSTGSGSAGEYGLLPLIWGTTKIAAIAMCVAVPVGLFTAIYLSQYATPKTRNTIKPVVEILAGIPTIVYGFFAISLVGPFLASFGQIIGVEIKATSALTAGLVMGIMIIPFISSLSDDILRQVPQAMRDGSLGLGATKSETIIRVVLPAALPGIVGAILLAVSRAIGETMIVVLAAGNSPVLRLNPLEATSTVTVSIVNQLTGDSDFAGPQSLVAFALGLTLFVMTLVLNVVALLIVKRYREQYD